MSELIIGIDKASSADEYTVMMLIKKLDTGDMKVMDSHIIKCENPSRMELEVKIIKFYWANIYNVGYTIEQMYARS